MISAAKLDEELSKARAFLVGDPHVKLEDRQVPVRPDKETEEVIGSQERMKAIIEMENPRLKTEAYLKQIEKL